MDIEDLIKYYIYCIATPQVVTWKRPKVINSGWIPTAWGKQRTLFSLSPFTFSSPYIQKSLKGRCILHQWPFSQLIGYACVYFTPGNPVMNWKEQIALNLTSDSDRKKGQKLCLFVFSFSIFWKSKPQSNFSPPGAASVTENSNVITMTTENHTDSYRHRTKGGFTCVH